jgi:hypothetical protein
MEIRMPIKPFFYFTFQKKVPECTRGSTSEDTLVSTDTLAYYQEFIAKKSLTTPENSSRIRYKL